MKLVAALPFEVIKLLQGVLQRLCQSRIGAHKKPLFGVWMYLGAQNCQNSALNKRQNWTACF